MSELADIEELAGKLGKMVPNKITELTPAEKQEIKDEYLSGNPRPGFYGMDDECEFNDTLRAMRYLPPHAYVVRVVEPYEENGEKTPEVREVFNVLHAATNLFNELFPHGRGARLDRYLAAERAKS